MKIWEEAYFCLKYSSEVVQAFVKWKEENKNFDPVREKKEFKEEIAQMSTRRISSELNMYIRESRWEHRSYLQDFDWFVDPNVSRLQFKIDLLKEELRSRPAEKQSKKEARQERGRLNRSFGRCKNK
jgi:hypothetical protein